MKRTRRRKRSRTSNIKILTMKKESTRIIRRSMCNTHIIIESSMRKRRMLPASKQKSMGSILASKITEIVDQVT
jgi:hypothetical protein